MKSLTFHESLKDGLFIFVAVVSTAVIVIFMTTPTGAQDKTIVTIHDAQIERSFVTEAGTVSEVLSRADFVIGSNDLVEPGLNEVVAGGTFSINIYRARLVTIVDGNTRSIVATAYQSPQRIAQVAGLTVHPEDEFETTRVNDFLNGVVGMELAVDRAEQIELILYDTVVKARTQATTVGDFLDGKGVVLAESDVVEPGLDSSITNGMRVAVTREGTKVVAQEEVVAYGREVINDPNAPIGSERVKIPGEAGRALVVYKVILSGGLENERIKLQKVTLLEPEDEVVIIGAKEIDISGDKLYWMNAAGIAQSDWPYVDFIITRESQWRHLVWNTLGSGAYGLCQSLPAYKMASAGDDYMTNPITQLRWCDKYAQARYGSWSQAFAFWQDNYWW